MGKKEIIAAKMKEWGLRLTDVELEQLLPAYENLLRWQSILGSMLHSRKIADGMTFPESEPLLMHAIERKAEPQ